MNEPMKFEHVPRHGMKWTTYPADVLPAWVADMDFDIAPPIRAALNDAIARSDIGYPLPYAKSGLTDVFCTRMRTKFGWEVKPNQVEFFSDVVQTIYLALLTLTERGDGVVIQTPIYPPFLQAVAETERHACICPLIATAQGYTIDFELMEANIDSTTRMLLLCHPHNPTGRAFTRSELEGLGALVLKHDLIVISDEIHADLMLDSRPHIPFASLNDDIAKRTITLTSPSKPFNVAGLCLAVAVFGSNELRARFRTLPEHVRGGRSALGIAAARAAWTESDSWLAATVDTLRANRDHVAKFIAGHWPAIKHSPPEATYLAWLDCRALGLKEEPQRFFLEQAKVALGEGLAFGEVGRGFVRLNFATSTVLLDQILTRMDGAIKQL